MDYLRQVGLSPKMIFEASDNDPTGKLTEVAIIVADSI